MIAPFLATMGLALIGGHLLFGEVPIAAFGDARVALGSMASTTLGAGALVVAWVAARGRMTSLLPTPLSLLVLAVGIAISEIGATHLAWFENERQVLAVLGALALTVAGARISPPWLRLRPTVGRAWWALLLLSVVSGVWALTGGARFQLLFGDDHAAFLYRIEQLRESFPAIPFYNPRWNGGVEAREFFPSGALNLFLLFAPLWYALEPARMYTMAVALVVFVVHPLAHYLAARVLGLGGAVRVLAALGAFTASTAYYKWSLGFGTMGFVTSVSIAPLAAAWWWRLVRDGGASSLAGWVGAALSSLLVLLWPLGGIVLLPTAVAVGVRSVRCGIRRVWPPALLLALLYTPYALTLLTTSPVAGLLSANVSPRVEATAIGEETRARSSESSAMPEVDETTESAADGSGIALHQAKIAPGFSGAEALREMARGMNPLYLVAFIPGLFLLRRGDAILFGSTIGWLAFIALVGPLVKPQLELERMFVVAALFAVIPAAVAIERWLTIPSLRERGATGATIVAFALLLLTPLLLWNMARGEKGVPIFYASPLVRQLVDAIDRYGGPGRVFFAGFTLHELDGGHVAPLATWSAHPLIASRYQHDRWSYTDAIPERYRKRKMEGVLAYLDLYNVTGVITHDRGWRKWFRKHPSHFREVWNGGRFRIFQRLTPAPGYFLQGAGEVVAQDGDRLRVRVESSPAVLRFNYLPILKSSGCVLEPARIDEEIQFIALDGCAAGTEVTIRASSIGNRLLGLVR